MTLGRRVSLQVEHSSSKRKMLPAGKKKKANWLWRAINQNISSLRVNNFDRISVVNFSREHGNPYDYAEQKRLPPLTFQQRTNLAAF